MGRSCVLVVVGVCICSAASAEIPDDPYAYDDGLTVWCGTSTIDSGDGLTADIDYCVYPAGAYPGSDYTPSPGEFAYVYQVHVTGASPVSKFQVELWPGSAADSIGHDASFGQPGGDSPAGWHFTGSGGNPAAANWTWPEGDPLASHSDVLVYSSPNPPLWLVGAAARGDQLASGPVPSPSPEPATVALLGIGSIALLRRRG